ncbi:uncharacterized protein J8A68_001556 [[Candida] subhashii]|uniref:RING-type E3 ubiquitin transferase n=1 Tax=[Candida] subhashii TaxID=561895 RepID=A0A8J5QMY2_9ASCO|nr:uncharacterized protein J8A68_001556 [[Candida] subhashii]KAG7664918.1 hypothetical protein J8A68_001556 [[Candida] subhashii]
MSEVHEHTCRICRGEATPSQPLYHPCKCRGSIKYIHQDCLLEWLKHSNKSTEKCDICNTPYKFRILYDPSMPQRIPPNMIWSKLLQIISTTLTKSISIGLYILCIIIQVPLFWKFTGRIYTWAIDGNLPIQNQTFLDALTFGEYNIQKVLQSLEHDDSGISIALITKLQKFMAYTYFGGLRHVLVTIVVHVALFIEREWVVRDEGYLKALHKKIGKEPRTKLVEMLQQALDALGPEDHPANNGPPQAAAGAEPVVRAINDLNNDNHIQNYNNLFEQALRRQIDQDLIWDDDHPALQDQAPLDDGEDTDLDNERRTVFEQQQQQPVQPPQQPDAHIDEPQLRGIVEGIFANREAEMDDDDDESENEDDEAEDQDVDEAIAAARDAGAAAAEAAAAAANGGQGGGGGIADILEVFGMSLNIKTPILLMLFCDLVISVYLFIMFLIPHVLGNMFTTVIGYLVRFTGLILSRVLTLGHFDSYLANVSLWIEKLGEHISERESLHFVLKSINAHLVKPINATIINLLFPTEPVVRTLSERIILLTIGYSLIGGTIYKLMEFLVSGPKPIMGSSRKIYKVLFEIRSTAKVFFIFAIEIFFFPVFCGWLLDFCIAPLILPSFTMTSQETGTTPETFIIIFLTSNYEILQVTYLRVLIYWASGTLYMLFFALFIGMVRGLILRPGVLFFIRSPDDPNARLIHDALVKPLKLQLSRIYLSAKFYTGFIFIGIGGVTWGLRYLVTPPPSLPTSSVLEEVSESVTQSTPPKNVFLPIQIPTGLTVLLPVYVCLLFSVRYQQLIIKYVRKYWIRAFDISAHKLRLSHFILNKPISHERGYIIYRNLWEQTLATAQPDYTKPVTYREALAIFKQNPDIKACFVPNGNYVRAPDNDTLSRKFIRKLFVPVTKDDKLIEEMNNDTTKTNQPKSGYETPSSDEEDEDETNVDNVYTIVYRPPNFKLRCFGLIFLLWIFAVILILSCILCGILMGRPIIRANSFLMAQFAPASFAKEFDLDWNLVDFSSIAVGLLFEILMLDAYDRKLANDAPIGGNNEIRNAAAGGVGVGEDNQAAANDDAAIPGVDPQAQPADQFRQLMMLNFRILFNLMPIHMLLVIPMMALWACWIVSVHKLCVNDPIQHYFTNDLEVEFLTDPITMIVHFFISFWTILPFLFYFLRSTFRNNQLPVREALKSFGIIPCLINYGIVHVPALLTTVALRYYEIGSEELYIYLWPLFMLVCMVVKSIYYGYHLYYTIDDQVKNEKYVRGRAIENVYVAEGNE